MSKQQAMKNNLEQFPAFIFNSIIDAYILMLVLGALAHRQHWQVAFGYFTCWLIVVAGSCVFPRLELVNRHLNSLVGKI